jgi:outer membrane protein OmpA-like peptidoglycan-associated protein
VPANQFVICDTCPAITRLTLLKTPVATVIPAIRFSQPLPTAEASTTTTAAAVKAEETEQLAVVHFRLNRDDLKGGERTKLRSLANNLQLADKLRVKGYTCDLGSKAYNDRLALRRAETVSRYIQSIGVSASKIEISGEGLCCYAGRDRAKNRRVEITKVTAQ